MPQNLVLGGARRGWFQTRRSRRVHLTDSFEYSEPARPGQVPQTRICWNGTIFQPNGDRDTIGVWENSGAVRNPNGVIQPDDLVILISLDPEPEVQVPAAQLEAPEVKRQTVDA
jgi:hypothetical protein